MVNTELLEALGYSRSDIEESEMISLDSASDKPFTGYLMRLTILVRAPGSKNEFLEFRDIGCLVSDSGSADLVLGQHGLLDVVKLTQDGLGRFASLER